MEYPQTLNVSVTQEHIEQGKRNDCGSCPIALAVAEQYPGFKVNVGSIWVEMTLPGECLGPANSIRLMSSCYGVPDGACRFIGRFDTGAPVEPFTFTAGRI